MESTIEQILADLKILTDMKEDWLQDAVKYVRRTFFPNWDKKQQWKIFECTEYLDTIRERRVGGECNTKEKTIKVNMACITENPNELHVLLIHEICHCITKGHGKGWQNKMFSKAEIAKKIGNIKLSKRIKKDVHNTTIIEWYEEHRLEVRIHGRISECLRQYPSISFDELMKIMIKDYGAPANISSKWIKVYKRIYNYYKYGKNRYK